VDDFYRIKRLPPYVLAEVTDLKVKARARGEDIIDLGMGNPDRPTPRHIVDKLVEAAKNPRNHRYSASRGIRRLRVAIARWYGDRFGVEVDPETEAIATIGSKEGLAHLMLALLQPGDYGVFQPVQIAGIVALEGPQAAVAEIAETYRRRRDVLVTGLGRLGWPVEKPRATMFVWAPVPGAFRAMGSLEFAKLLLAEAKVAVSPGLGFGEYGEGYVRFALVENEHRIRQAVRGIQAALG
jgi:aspartate/methionine/tyrosine aminotransferase